MLGLLGLLGLLGSPVAGLVIFSTVSGTAIQASGVNCSEDSVLYAPVLY